ncbi:MAG: hypothetical protein O2820_17545 [Planctomycetota bacterium]|nr:hypothetical protein [Planctomycetota bacterium]MDA1251024.1 hypothetical protein [Planctomycetota bacterium]
MKITLRVLAVLCLFGGGYFLGTQNAFQPAAVNAQGFGAPAGGGEDAIQIAITEANDAIKKAADLLAQDGRYVPASKTPNVSAILSGGVDAMSDLETDRGVDPETFAALYADDSVDELAVDMDRDSLGRLTYKGKVVRMYSVSRLKKLYKMRMQYAGGKDNQPAATF